MTRETAPLAESEQQGTAAPPAPRRLASLDAFRGLTIIGMLLVNNVALDWHTPAQLKHAPWNGGVHFADLVFPWFLLIVGVAIPYAWAAHRRKGWGRARYLGRAAGRAAALVALGCLIDSSIARRPLFDLDVLQLIGLSYFVAAAITMRLTPAPRLLTALALLVAHWAVLRHVPVPGMPTGTLEPGRNVVAYANQHVLARFHVAGLISVVPASALVLIGTLFGDILRGERIAPPKRFGMVMGAGLILAAGGALWSLSLPYSKAVWTASYILFTGGLGALVLGTMYGLLDVTEGGRRRQGWAVPLLVFGSNAIVAYVAPILVKLYVLQVLFWPGTQLTVQQGLLHAAVQRWGVVDGGWAYTLSYIGVCWLALAVLYRFKIFLRV